MEQYWNSLSRISNDNEETVAFLIAGALCYAENLAMVELDITCHTDVLRLIIDKLQRSHCREFVISHDSLSTHNSIIAMVAVARYRECVIKELGGNQTPCTLQVCNDTEKLREAQHVYRVPLISRWISNVRRILRKVAILLGISKFSERDFL
ncbi:hypothetical protein ACSZMZ_11640 [Aeromonas veronii]